MKEFKGFMHGVNLGGWLSQCNHKKETYDNWIKEEDIKTISNWGLDHVRLPVDYNLVETAEGEYKEDGFAYIQKAIDWCKKYNLNIVLDLHKTAGYSFFSGYSENGFFDDPALQERFYKLWEEFAKRYASNGEMICFELLNELTDPSYSDPWNKIVKTVIQRIRKIAPVTKILVGGYWNNSFDALKDLENPYDENVVYNFHCYEPLLFTHQAATWLGEKMPADFRWPLQSKFADYQKETIVRINAGCANFTRFNENDSVTEEYFDTIFANAIQVAKERNVILYCGEYGVIDQADPEEALKWYQMITKILDKYNIGRAAWSYKGMNFGLADKWIESKRNEILKLM